MRLADRAVFDGRDSTDASLNVALASCKLLCSDSRLKTSEPYHIAGEGGLVEEA